MVSVDDYTLNRSRIDICKPLLNYRYLDMADQISYSLDGSCPVLGPHRC